MIKGHEKETYELTDYELKLLPMMLAGFRTKIGVDNAIKSNEICAGFEASGHKLTGVRLRKMVNYIRTNKLVLNLISSSKGYWIENDKERVKKFQESMIQRSNEIMRVANSFN